MHKPIIKKVLFKKSVSNLDQLPNDNIPEVAFIGRSNVGKSALLNALFGQKNIVKVSSTPGKTKLINFFIVNDIYHFVDLPGYGYAKTSKNLINSWKKLIEGYLIGSKSIKLICLLIDSRHKIMQSDQDMINWLIHYELPFIIVLTKGDKISQSKLFNQLKYFQSLVPAIDILPFSIKNQKYIIQLTDYIINTIK